jgi:hypothetical protein
MPNWVSNELSITGELQTVRQLFSEVTIKNEDGQDEFDFNAIIPMPAHQPDLTKANPFWRGDVGSEEREKFGSNNEIDWAYENWGTKWGACDSWLTPPWNTKDSANATGSISFNTAWGGVPNLMSSLSKKFPSLTFEYEYTDDEGEGESYVFKKGKSV